MKLFIEIAFTLFVIVWSSTLMAKQILASEDQQTSLIELYTSEGCSSCPPADRWLSGLKSQQGLWSNFIPVAFHVDYWDYIGWSDPYASKANSQRQRRYATEYGERTVYTPGLRLNGADWRDWRRSTKFSPVTKELVGKLTLTIDVDGSYNATFKGVEDSDAQLTVVVLGMGLQQEVTRGENKGRKLIHDFVVLRKSTVASSTPGRWSGHLVKPSVIAQSYAVVAWVTQDGRLTPTQAVGGLTSIFD